MESTFEMPILIYVTNLNETLELELCRYDVMYDVVILALLLLLRCIKGDASHAGFKVPYTRSDLA